MHEGSDDRHRPLARAGAALGAGLRFLSRLPVPRLGALDDPARLPDLTRQAWALPLAGAVIGLAGAASLWLTSSLGLPALPAAAVAIAVGVVVTGALHEDGLADTADGLAAGGNAERRLAVMRDSRIGAMGATAVALSLILRVSALAAIVDASATAAVVALITANTASRAAALAPLALLPPARTDGIAAAAGKPAGTAFAAALAVAAAVVLALLTASAGFLAGLAGLAAAALATLVLLRIARRTLGGGTGDIAGACEQVATCAFLLAVSAMVA